MWGWGGIASVLSRGLAMSLSVSAREEGRPGWAISVPWTLLGTGPASLGRRGSPMLLRVGICILRPEKSRTRLLQCLPRPEVSQLPSCVGGTGFSDGPSAAGRLRELVWWLVMALGDQSGP